MKFSYQYDEKSPKITFSLSPDSTLTEVLEAFEDFLRGVTYSFDGHLTIEGGTDEVDNVA